MPRKPKMPQDDPAESKRFIEMAREIGADESEQGRKAFEKVFDKVTRSTSGKQRGDDADHGRQKMGDSKRRTKAKSTAKRSH